MLDNSYENIGGKIKNWAKWIFIVEAIGSIIAAITLPVLLSDNDDPVEFIWVSLIIIFFGPIIAFVSSWILYAFGELVEKTCDNESNTRMIVKLLKENDAQKTKHVGTTTYYGSSEQKATNTSTYKWICYGCKKMRTQSPCEHCGKE